jgi:hypothetical protein
MSGEWYNDMRAASVVSTVYDNINIIHTGSSCPADLQLQLWTHAGYNFRQSEGYLLILSAWDGGTAMANTEVSVCNVRCFAQTTTGYSVVDYVTSSFAGWDPVLPGSSLLTGQTAFNGSAASAPGWGVYRESQEPHLLYIWDGGTYKAAVNQDHRWTVFEVSVRGKKFYPLYYYTQA